MTLPQIHRTKPLRPCVVITIKSTSSDSATDTMPRVGVAACYLWPIVEGWDNLVRVRARQNAGVREVAQKFPKLVENDDKTRLGLAGMEKLALANPPSFMVYAAVALATKFRRDGGWARGR